MFPSSHMISALSKEDFIKIAWEVVGRKMEKSLLLSDIYETAKTSAGLPVAPESDAIRMFRMMLAEGRSLIRQRHAIEDRAVELLGDRPDFQRHCTPSQASGRSTPDHFGRDRRHAPFQTSPPVPEVLRHGSGHRSVRHVPRPKQDLQIWQRSPAPDFVARRADRRSEEGQYRVRVPRQTGGPSGASVGDVGACARRNPKQKRVSEHMAIRTSTNIV